MFYSNCDEGYNEKQQRLRRELDQAMVKNDPKEAKRVYQQLKEHEDKGEPSIFLAWLP